MLSNSIAGFSENAIAMALHCGLCKNRNRGALRVTESYCVADVASLVYDKLESKEKLCRRHLRFFGSLF